MSNNRKGGPGCKPGQNQSYLEQLVAERLDLGEDIEIPEFVQAGSLEITSGSYPGIVSDLPHGQVGLAIPLRIVALQKVTIVDWRIAVPWDPVCYVSDLREERGRYYAGDPSDPITSYPVAEVLNDHLNEPSLLMRRGQKIEGVLIGYSTEPMPKQIESGTVKVEVMLVDSSDRGYSTAMSLPVQRRRAYPILGTNSATATRASRSLEN